MLDHPLTPGPTSAVEKGPWHYGADYVAVHFKGGAATLTELVPTPFEIHDGTGMAYVCEIISVGESAPDMVTSRPDRTLYREAAIGLRTRYKERMGIFYPVMWVTTEWSLLRGLLNGYQKRLADQISMTRLHPLNPGLKPISAGSSFGGFCVKGPEETLSIEVQIERQGGASDLPAYGATFGMRRYPSTDISQQNIEEPVEITRSNSRVSDVWVGKGRIETNLDLGEIEPTLGAVYRGGFTISGSKVLR